MIVIGAEAIEMVNVVESGSDNIKYYELRNCADFRLWLLVVTIHLLLSY